MNDLVVIALPWTESRSGALYMFDYNYKYDYSLSNTFSCRSSEDANPQSVDYWSSILPNRPAGCKGTIIKQPSTKNEFKNKSPDNKEIRHWY